jgi:hypothetical protein
MKQQNAIKEKDKYRNNQYPLENQKLQQLLKTKPTNTLKAPETGIENIEK